MHVLDVQQGIRHRFTPRIWPFHPSFFQDVLPKIEVSIDFFSQKRSWKNIGECAWDDFLPKVRDMDNPQTKVQSIILCLFGWSLFMGSTMCKSPCCSNIWGSNSKSWSSKFWVALRTLGDPNFSLGPRQEKQSPAGSISGWIERSVQSKGMWNLLSNRLPQTDA